MKNDLKGEGDLWKVPGILFSSLLSGFRSGTDLSVFRLILLLLAAVQLLLLLALPLPASDLSEMEQIVSREPARRNESIFLLILRPQTPKLEPEKSGVSCHDHLRGVYEIHILYYSKTIKRLIFKNSTITSTRRNLREVTTHLRYAEVKNFGESSGANIQLLEPQQSGKRRDTGPSRETKNHRSASLFAVDIWSSPGTGKRKSGMRDRGKQVDRWFRVFWDYFFEV